MRETKSKFTGFPGIRKAFRPAWLLLFFGCLVCANIATASTTGGDTQDVSIFDNWTSVPGADLSGFFDLGVNPFPDEPDPSQTWTSQQNIAILNYWLSLVAELGDDPSLLPSLYGLGMNDPSTDSSNLSANNFSSGSTESNFLDAGAAVSNTPEPVTGVLLGAGLIIVCSYAWRRSRRLDCRQDM